MKKKNKSILHQTAFKKNLRTFGDFFHLLYLFSCPQLNEKIDTTVILNDTVK